MKNTKPHIKFIRNTLLLLVVLFSLTPCSVKESGIEVFNIEYQRPLNKTKALTSQVDSCENLVFNQVETVESQKVVEVNLLSKTSPKTFLFLKDSEKGNIKKHNKKSLDLGLPLYILYNRLKLDIA